MSANGRALSVLGGIGVVAVMTAAAAFAATSWHGKAVRAGGNVSSISCTSAGNCAAGGANNSGAFVQNEKKGVWRAAVDLPGTVGGSVASISCTPAGNCAAGGYYLDASAPGGQQAFLVDETNGVWGNPIDVPGVAGGGVGSVSCASAGNCAAVGGSGADGYPGFVISETNGVWGDAISVDTSQPGDSPVRSVSCWSAGNCVAGGGYIDWTSNPSGAEGAVLLREKNGVWGQAIKIPIDVGPETSYPGVQSISCVSATSCAAGGEPFVMSETKGVWRKPVAAPGPFGGVYSVSCGSPGNCAAGGGINDGYGDYSGFVMNSKNGVWGKKRMVGGNMVTSVSCASAGNCAATGWSYGPRTFVVAETASVWGQATTLGGVAAASWGVTISCVKTPRCAVGGQVTGTTGFVTSP